MGWFDEQIKQRIRNDDDMFSDAMVGIAGSVMGSKIVAALNNELQKANNAIEEILKFYHAKPVEVPDSIKDINDRLEYCLRPHGIMRRTVLLTNGWYRDAVGAMLAIRKADGLPVALLPNGFGGYTYFDPEKGKRVRITKKSQKLFEEEAIAFYGSFPLKKLGLKDILAFIFHTMSYADRIAYGVATLVVTLVGLLIPRLSNLLFSVVVVSQSMQLLVSLTFFMLCVTITSLILKSIQSMLLSRIKTKMKICVQAATMMRVMSLPTDFFKQYSSGDLASRANSINTLCQTLVSAIFSTGLTSIFSLVYIVQIFRYAPALVVPALIIIVVTIAVSVITAMIQQRVGREQMKLSAREHGLSYSLISGIQKIKLAGAEKRAFAKWGKEYAKQVKLEYDPPAVIKFNSVLTLAISLIGQIVMYYFALQSSISVADYYSFNAAYGTLSGAFLSLASIAVTVANIKPILDLLKPIFDATPEIAEGKRVIERLSGGIELNNVSFRYSESSPLIIDDLSLKIRPGQYVAVVGETGCGKSTLIRLLLGFEHPQKGAVYYDGKDINAVDMKSLRRKIGVVMQNGKLFSGSVYSNIVISAPWLSMDGAWEAAELAGIADDIHKMPMGMHTLISEGNGGISGGQRQRLMIARAIAPKPRILIFDEATSALDNITQKKVAESLDNLKCTRIVVAHRLSTIKQCDRIIYLEGGKIVEDGTYDELVAKGEKFAALIARQRLDDDQINKS